MKNTIIVIFIFLLASIVNNIKAQNLDEIKAKNDSLYSLFSSSNWYIETAPNYKVFSRSQMFQTMLLMKDKKLTKQVRLARTKRTFGFLFSLTATIMSFIPKAYDTSSGAYVKSTTTVTGLFARPAALLFFVPGLIMQATWRENERKAKERYNNVMIEKFGEK